MSICLSQRIFLIIWLIHYECKKYLLYQEKLLNSGFVMQQLINPISLKEIRNAIQASLK